MNITIYYLSKKIIIQKKIQNTDNQFIIDIDELNKKNIVPTFELFINHPTQQLLIFETNHIEDAFDKFKKEFKNIFAGGGLIKKDGQYLFIYRLKKWDLPKGKLEMGESPEDGAIRECEEECGITKLKIIKDLTPRYHMYEHKKGYALKKTYWYLMDTQHEGKLIPQLEENIEKVEWFNEQKIKTDILPDTYPAILDVIHECIKF